MFWKSVYKHGALNQFKRYWFLSAFSVQVLSEPNLPADLSYIQCTVLVGLIILFFWYLKQYWLQAAYEIFKESHTDSDVISIFLVHRRVSGTRLEFFKHFHHSHRSHSVCLLQRKPGLRFPLCFSAEDHSSPGGSPESGDVGLPA